MFEQVAEALPVAQAILDQRGGAVAEHGRSAHSPKARLTDNRVAGRVRLAGGDPVAAWLREAQAAARLNNPRVVTVFDVVEEAGSIWLVMELVDAPSLAQVVVDGGPIPHLL